MPPLAGKLEDRTAHIGVLGLGYVGLPLAMAFARAGFRVTGFDVDRPRIRGLAAGRSHIPDVPQADLRQMLRVGRFKPTASFEALSRCDAIVICVPTPLRKTKEPDVQFIVSAAKSIVPRLRKGQLIVLESTTYPGTTRDLVLPMLQKGGLRVGRDFHLAFSPERVDPANKAFRIENTPKVVGGITPACGQLAGKLYAQIVSRVVPVSGAEAAEMVKLLENTFRAINIGLANEMALMCHKLGLDVWEVVGAASTKPFGFMPFYPGPGLGGHCIPVDPSYLAWKMKALNFEPRFIELASTINAHMPDYAVERVAELLNGLGKSVKGSRVLALGVAYKPEVSDVRESPALDVITLLERRGAKVAYHDPFVPSVAIEGRRMRSVRLDARVLERADLAIILTAHKGVDYRQVVKRAPLVFDTRNAAAGLSAPNLHRL